MIEVHYSPTPNCWKVIILLEETGSPYVLRRYDLFKGEHLVPAFRRINPNNKLPAIVDTAPADGGAPLAIFESGAILIYLAEKSGQFLSQEIRSRTLTLQWLAWQVSGLGPMMGQAGHFVRYAREQHPYSINRYVQESRRLLHVLEYRLRESEYLSEGVLYCRHCGVALDQVCRAPRDRSCEYPQVTRWHAAVQSRPAVVRVFTSRQTAPDPAYVQEKRRLTDEEWSNTYGERMLAVPRARHLECSGYSWAEGHVDLRQWS